MRNDKPDSLFGDLEDTSEWDGSKPEKPVRKTGTFTEDIGDVAIPGFVEDCPKCNGTGTWRGYSRYGRKCFKCKGTGKLQFKTSPEARAKSRQYAQKRKARNLEQNFEAAMAAQDDDVREWLTTNIEAGNSFAVSLSEGMRKYGNLTEGQVNGIRKAIAREADAADKGAEWAELNPAEFAWLERESEKGNEFAESLLNGQWGLRKRGTLSDNQVAAIQRNLEKEKQFAPSDIDLRGLHLHKTGGGARRSYFAVPDGDTRLKLCVRSPGKNSRYHGWLFVDDGAAYGSRQTYGKQPPEALYAGKVQDALRAILADPKGAAIAYGKLTGTCGVCGRLLEDEDSVAAGIGPVCAAKF